MHKMKEKVRMQGLRERKDCKMYAGFERAKV